MASIVGGLIVGILEFAFRLVSEILPTVCYFTGLALVFAATLGRVAVEFPKNLTRVGWTGELRIARSPQGRTPLSPALGVIIGFIIWAIIVSASIVFYAHMTANRDQSRPGGARAFGCRKACCLH